MPATKQTPIETVWTIGHSTRTLDALVEAIEPYGVEIVVDVRRFPGSRRHPQFARESLAASLPERGIAYRWMPELGGRRRAASDSPNTAWRNASFRGYADYMATEAFATALDDLLQIARGQRTVIMCAELLWWRCHRALISDALRIRSLEVVHIVDASESIRHPFTSAARVIDGRLSYAASDERQQMQLLWCCASDGRCHS